MLTCLYPLFSSPIKASHLKKVFFPISNQNKDTPSIEVKGKYMCPLSCVHCGTQSVAYLSSATAKILCKGGLVVFLFQISCTSCCHGVHDWTLRKPSSNSVLKLSEAHGLWTMGTAFNKLQGGLCSYIHCVVQPKLLLFLPS